ncbi:hypothetical protein TSUD_77320 [Trifolium subterraneum]|uniref:3'-5' exonuclease domain-containing protein n=1 Tax=Trifolium subterraneum TaxID=3900 RepID=A0A2Z6MAV6_TRISU|nr:hypothetical protein TSUD_77320 [Trifolium subterraneum]
METTTVAVTDQNLLNSSNMTVVNCQNSPDKSNITVNFNGTMIKVVVTASASVVDEWIESTVLVSDEFHRRQKLVVALSVDPSANTLQLCVNRRCLIFQLSQANDVPPSLRSFLCDPACKFTGFLTKWHRSKLLSCRHRLKMQFGPVDVRYIEAGFENCSVEEMIQKFLGCNVELKEEIKTSDWSVQNLSNDQVLYACVECYCAFFIGKNLRSWYGDI